MFCKVTRKKLIRSGDCEKLTFAWLVDDFLRMYVSRSPRLNGGKPERCVARPSSGVSR